MSAEIIDGRKVAELIRNSVREDVEQWVEKGNRPPFLQVILVGDDPASIVYTGTKSKAMNNDEVKTQIRVIGKYFINSPANPGQKIRGRKAAKVVAVEDIIGSAIFLEASPYA